jgi:hypothetical protein
MPGRLSTRAVDIAGRDLGVAREEHALSTFCDDRPRC